MRAISIVGPKKSGKTTLGLRLAETLQQEGMTVAVAKSTHHGFDGQDTDTGQYAKKKITVVGMGPDESFIRWPDKANLLSLLPLIKADILLVEGGKGIHWLPRILVLDAIPEEGIDWLSPSLAIAVYGRLTLPNIPNISSVTELASLIQKKAFILPGLDCGSCGRDDCAALAQEIVSDTASLKDCAALNSSVNIKINGHQLGMNTFSERIVASTIKGLLQELKGFAHGKADIELDV